MDTQWLKSAQENFREAVSQENWGVAKAVCDDVNERGFHVEALLMITELESKLPSAPHGYVLGFLKKKNEEYKAKGLVPTLDMLIEDLTN